MNRFILAAICLALVSCDGWPTSLVNASASPIRLSYQHSRYEFPSATFELANGQSVVLDREMRLKDLVQITVIDDERTWTIRGEELSKLKRECPAYQCELIYHGNGLLEARPR